MSEEATQKIVNDELPEEDEPDGPPAKIVRQGARAGKGLYYRAPSESSSSSEDEAKMPDIGKYLAKFGLSSADKVKMARAFANYEAQRTRKRERE